MLQAVTAVLRRSRARQENQRQSRVQRMRWPNQHWPDVLIIFSTYAAPHARSSCRLPFRESRHGCDLCECHRLLWSNDAFPLHHRLVGPWSWISIRRHSFPILPLPITSPMCFEFDGRCGCAALRPRVVREFLSTHWLSQLQDDRHPMQLLLQGDQDSSRPTKRFS